MKTLNQVMTAMATIFPDGTVEGLKYNLPPDGSSTIFQAVDGKVMFNGLVIFLTIHSGLNSKQAAVLSALYKTAAAFLDRGLPSSAFTANMLIAAGLPMFDDPVGSYGVQSGASLATEMELEEFDHVLQSFIGVLRKSVNDPQQSQGSGFLGVGAGGGIQKDKLPSLAQVGTAGGMNSTYSPTVSQQTASPKPSNNQDRAANILDNLND